VETPENKFLDPEGNAITRREIPTAGPPKVSKGYWDSVVRRLKLLAHDQVLRLIFPPDTQVESLRSSIHWAGTRAGRKLGVTMRGSCIYVWDTGVSRERKRYHPPRKAIRCAACGKLIERPRPKQLVHAGIGNKKSDCQKALRHAKRHGGSASEVWSRMRSPI
jgi:hypothetical protein